MIPFYKSEAEGGCGVIGIASDIKIAGRHLLSSLCQMKNRGNGKGGGIAACGLSPEAFGVTQEVLNHDTLLAIGYLDESSKHKLEKEFIHPIFDLDHEFRVPHLKKHMEVNPPKVHLYFVKVKQSAIDAFIAKNPHAHLSIASIQDMIVYQNSQRINQAYYVSDGDKKAFVLSHGKDLLVLKMVGFGDEVIEYYKLEDFKAHVWIGHHRYPTKGRIWHPGGAHPFIGLNEALVHNGDFANYFSLCEYLSERNIFPHFLTDTEVAALLFDLLYRSYKYPLEYVIEALAPTTMRDFALLPQEKREIYSMIQKVHTRSSPDGPWFFLIAQSVIEKKRPVFRLIGITDTSMLRPQVFAIQRGEHSIGLIASEKQAIDATLHSLSSEDKKFWTHADVYWNARGGSFTDGGAYSFSVYPESKGKAKLICTDKFGNEKLSQKVPLPYTHTKIKTTQVIEIPKLNPTELLLWAKKKLLNWNYEEVFLFLNSINQIPQDRAIDFLTKLYDLRYPLHKMRRSSLLALLNDAINSLFSSIASLETSSFAYLEKNRPFEPKKECHTLVINALGFDSEGDASLALKLAEMVKKGFKKVIIYQCQGQRFIGSSLGKESTGIEIDVYGSSGDYLGSGIDGAKITVHNSAQDQVAQIMKEGTLVIHGDVGQTLMYGAKGGIVYIRGNAAGRPLINGVSSLKAIINGTCLDYLAESFMAGDPLKGGGFAIINGMTHDDEGNWIEMDAPYPGNNLFSLASGGAIFIRDPECKVSVEQLNGGHFVEMTAQDWKLILPYLEENARLFDLPIETLLTLSGEVLDYKKVYRKVSPSVIHALQPEEAWVRVKG